MCNAYIIENDDEGKRLDMVLTERLEGFTRSAMSRLIDGQCVFVNGKPSKAGYRVRLGDCVNVALPENTYPDALPESIPLDVIYEDNDIIIINKPAGMVVHPAAGHYTGTLVNALLHRCGDSLSGINGVMRPGIVHRLDRDTSGIIVAAKNDAAHQTLARQLAERTMERTYLAVAAGIIHDDKGTINRPIARDPKNRLKMSVQPNGREAITNYTVLERYKNHTLVEVSLHTGRTHQIRVHFASINRPILGDTLYGAEKQSYGLTGQLLHAKSLGLTHPNGEHMRFEAPPPDVFNKTIKKLEMSHVR